MRSLTRRLICICLLLALCATAFAITSTATTAGLIVVTHKNGTTTPYNAANTDRARGDALLSAVAAYQAGDTIQLAAQTFEINRSIYLPSGCRLTGAGMYSGCKIKVANAAHTTLTAPVSQQTTSLTTQLQVADSTGFRVGQAIGIYRPDDDPASVRNGSPVVRDVCLVTAVGAGTITISHGMNAPGGYAIGSIVFTAFNAIELNQFAIDNNVGSGMGPRLTNPTSNVTIEGIEIDGNYTGQYQIGPSDEFQCGIHVAASSYVTIQRCYVHDTANAGIEFSHISTAGSDHLVIDSCRAENAAAKGALHLDCTNGLRVTDNIIADTMPGAKLDTLAAIFLHGLAPSPHMINVVISGNDITTGNASGAGNFGINMGGYCFNVTISDNKFHNCPPGAIGTYDDGGLPGANVGIMITGNTFDACGTISNTYAAICGTLGRSSRNMVIQGNHFTGSVGPAIADGMIGTVISNNIIEQASGIAGIYSAGFQPIITGNRVHATSDANWCIVTSPTEQGSGCTFHVTGTALTGGHIESGGTSYRDGDLLLVQGGATNGLIRVTTTAGVVTSFSIADAGSGYSAAVKSTCQPTFALIANNVLQVDGWHVEGIYIGKQWGNQSNTQPDIVTLLNNVVLCPASSNQATNYYTAVTGSVVNTTGGASKI